MNTNNEVNKLARQERTNKNNEALRETAERLSRIFEAHNVHLQALAKEIDKNRTTLFNYTSGNTEINEPTVIQIGEKFGLKPLEVRYKEKVYQESDLEWVNTVSNLYIDKKQPLTPAEIRSKINAKCYTFYRDKVIDFERVHSADIVDKAKELLEMYQIGLQHGGSTELIINPPIDD